MKKIYVAHPFQGKRENMQAITHICQLLVKFGIMPISPVHAFAFLNDKVSEDREKALKFCEELVETCDAIFLFGEWQKSDGCIRERNVALLEMIPIYEVIGWGADNNPIFKHDPPKWMQRR